ncbi:MAG: penicillin-binding transpeptidase domain-containing protein [Bacteroidota bacterium]
MKKVLFSLPFICNFLFLISVSSCSVNKAKIDNDLATYYESSKLEGCFTLLDNAKGEITVYNMSMDTTRYSPASTFEILNSLIVLHTGVVTDENMMIKWDSTLRSTPSWNKDLNIVNAFKENAVPFFQEVTRRTGRDTLKSWIDSISYGNRNVDGTLDSFWMNNKLKISPDEQLGFLKRLYFDQLPFRKSVQESVRNMMIQEDNTAYKLSYKTGITFDENNNLISWTIGWVEENRHVYFFVNLIKTQDKNIEMKKTGLGITKDILTHYGFFKGFK